jgi:hypothetical protein
MLQPESRTSGVSLIRCRIIRDIIYDVLALFRAAAQEYGDASNPEPEECSSPSPVYGLEGTGPVTLDCGKGAFDPDAEPGPFSFEWGCVGPHPDGCFQADGSPLSFADNSPIQVRREDRPVSVWEALKNGRSALLR